MSVQCSHGSTAVAVKLGAELSNFDLGTSCNTRKVLRVRRQIEQRTYNLDGRLDAILERILLDLSPSEGCA